MTVALKNTYLDQPAATDTDVVTSQPNTVTRIVKCTATNDTTTPTTITFHKVASGGSVADTNLILNAKVLGNKETYECPEVVGQVLDPGDIISAKAGDADQVSLSIDVVELT